jgi:transcriptional/translational regulatory protein YebC/TACO1
LLQEWIDLSDVTVKADFDKLVSVLDDLEDVDDVFGNVKKAES